MAHRPESVAPPEIFYNDSEARKYTTSSRIVEIQAKLSERALELLNLPNDGVPRLLLDIGCGSGLSGELLSENGHEWVGMDISPSMLEVAVERETQGDLLLSDMGQGLGLRSAVFDGAISISAVQWLCNADKTCNEPRTRLKNFFQSLYRCLSRGARAVLQIYPNGVQQLEMISMAAMKAGFSGGLVVDYPHSTRAKKYFLCLMAGPPSVDSTLPKAKGEGGGSDSEDADMEDGDEGDSDDSDGGNQEKKESTVSFLHRQRAARKQRMQPQRSRKGKTWIIKKKEQRRQRGHINVPRDTKYTGRKRKTGF